MSEPVRPRTDVIDWARGLVMVLMALDHTRDFVGDVSINAVDAAQSYPTLYATRWVTHLCAPTFVFLTGVGAYLSRTRGRSTGQLAVYLLTRGAWLVLLEFTLVHTCWEMYNPNFHSLRVQVIAAIGFSMIALAGLVWLPSRVVGLIGLVVAFGHNALDPIAPEQFGSFAWLWRALHATGDVQVGEVRVSIPYAILPWVGVMALGYGCGEVFLRERPRRRSALVLGGAILLAAFVIFRVTNVYGNPKPWASFADPTRTAMAIFDCEKYPPSAAYLWATLGIMALTIACVDRVAGPPGRWLVTFGRVPMFFYLIHLPVIHVFAVTIYIIGRSLGYFPPPELLRQLGGMRNDLWVVYLAWIGVVFTLYWPCRWFAGVKARNRNVLLSYL